MSSRAHDRLDQDSKRPSAAAPTSGVQPGSTAHSRFSALDSGRVLSSALPEGAVQLRTISWVIFQDLHVLIHDVQDPDQSEWDQSLAAVAPYVHSNTLKGVLVRSFGGGPTPHQRRQVIELYEGKQMPVANVSDSAVTRAITTAMSWFYRGTMRSYSPKDLPQAIRYLGIPETSRDQVLGVVCALCVARGKRAM